MLLHAGSSCLKKWVNVRFFMVSNLLFGALETSQGSDRDDP